MFSVCICVYVVFFFLFFMYHGTRADINECEQPGLCGPHGECLNTDSSFHCICEQGFSISADGRTCEGKMNNKTSCNYCMIKQRGDAFLF